MKKMIPVYVLQVAMLVMVFVISNKIMGELRALKTEIKAELSSTKTNTGDFQDNFNVPATRVIVVSR